MFTVKSIGGLVDAGSTGRMLRNWGTRRAGPTAEVMESLHIVRARAANMRRNNPWVARAVFMASVNEIGTGIKPTPTTGNDTLNTQLRELFAEYLHYADYQGLLNIYGLQAAMVTARKEAGECFILIRRNRKDAAGDSPVPLEFQLVEGDQVAEDLHSADYNGNIITSGVETTPAGKILAYWFHDRHPDQATLRLRDSTVKTRVRVPKKDVLHHMRPDRPSQLRARPEVSRAMLRANNFEEYTEAELTRKKVRADLTGTIERPLPLNAEGDPFTGATTQETDSDGVSVTEFQTGSFTELEAGEKLNLFPADQNGQGYGEYQRWQLFGIAAAANIPYQLLTQDFSEINDRIWRGIMNNYQRELQHIQELYIVPQVCRPMWIEFVKRAVATGAVTLPAGMTLRKATSAVHRPQSFAFIHPVQDVDSKIKLIEAGLKSRTAVVDEISTGNESAADVDDQRKADNDRAESMGLPLGIEDTSTASEETNVVDNDNNSNPKNGAKADEKQ